MRPKTRDAIQKALFEAFFVVPAVVLALAADTRRTLTPGGAMALPAVASATASVVAGS